MTRTVCTGLVLHVLGLVTVTAMAGSTRAKAGAELPPSPYVILGSRLLDPPPLEAVPICVPARLSLQLGDFEKWVGEGDFDEAQKALTAYASTVAIQEPEEHERDLALLRAALAARRGSERAQRLDVRAQLEHITKREKQTDRLVCALLESARLSILLRLLPEADAALNRIRARLSWLGADHPSLESARFYDAELLYRRGDGFSAHLVYRELTLSKNSRMAAAARLRLTDLSFDAGKSRSVQLEYETLLPHGAAFGAHMTDWSLRAAEAALDAGDFGAARAWFERYTSEVGDRDARDLVEIRRADLEVLEGRPGEARKRLRALWRRKGDLDIDSLARIRQVDLGVSSDAPDARIAALRAATSSANRGVRIYALAVLVHELVQQGKLDEGVAAVTRLAYEGASPVLARHFKRDLHDLLASSRREAAEDEGCPRVVRRLGGRYGVLLGHASDPAPFLALGSCFERMHLQDLAITLYRALTRTYGLRVANEVALPLARASLAVGDVSLARAAAEVNIRHGGERILEWKAILAVAEVALEHDAGARKLFRELLQGDKLPDQRVSLALSFATLIARQPYDDDDDDRLLEKTLLSVADAMRASEASTFGEATMLVATRLRSGDEPRRAAVFYSLASETLPVGARRSEARYWANRFDPESRTPGETGDPEATGPWSQLADYEAKARTLIDRYQLEGLR